MAHIPADIADLYEVHDYRHAAAILTTEYPELFQELCTVLRQFRLTDAMIREFGGNESPIPKAFSAHLRPMGWEERQLSAEIVVDGQTAIELGTHRIDYVKGEVAFDLEWNSKDQTFDRDLAAFRAFFQYNRISVGVLVTRSTSLHDYFRTLGTYTTRYGNESPIIKKYGASTTHMDQLLPRLHAGRSGGCPVLALGITTALIPSSE